MAWESLQLDVQKLLWPVVVCHKGSRNFGLNQSLREGEQHELGGWLRKVRVRSSGVRQFGEAMYYILDEDKGFCRVKQNEIKESFPFHKILGVAAHELKGLDSKVHYIFRVLAYRNGEEVAIELAPPDTSDRNVAIAWTAALQLRAKCYDPVLDLDHERALKVAIWCQSLYRGFCGRIRAERLKAKKLKGLQNSKFGIQKMVSGFFVSKIEDLSSGEDEEFDADESTIFAKTEEKGPTPLPKPASFPFMQFSLFRKSLTRKSLTSNGSNHSLPITTTTNDVRVEIEDPVSAAPDVLKTVTIEDEVWENQRWSAVAVRGTQVIRGWSEIALMPTDRGAFSDRAGNISWDSLSAIQVTPDWKVTKDWTLDSSSNQCNSEGWTYAPTFPALDSNLASGRSNTSPSARWLVRRRRWYRIRQCEKSEKELLAFSGWLGMRGIVTGRWTNHFTFLPLSRSKEHLGYPLCYFRERVRIFDEALNFRFDFHSISPKLLKVKYLDNSCVVSDACATRDQPGLFSLHLCGEGEPRLFNAHSAEARARWVQAIARAIGESPGPCYESIANRRSMSKGVAWELIRASEAVKDVVGGSMKGVKVGLLTLTRSSTIERNFPRSASSPAEQSDAELLLVENLRSKYRHESKLWVSSPPLRKESIDSLTSNGERSISPRKKGENFKFEENEDRENSADASATAAIEETPIKKKLSLPAFKRRQTPPQRMSDLSPHRLELKTDAPPSLSLTIVPIPEGSEVVEKVGKLSEGPFVIPPPYENIMFDGSFDISADEFDKFFFQEEEFTRDILQADKMSEISLEPWTNGTTPGSEHRRTYRIPRAGIVPPSPAFHLLTRVQSEVGKGYVVDQVCSCPDVPYGKFFSNDFRNVILAEGPQRCRVIISQKVTLNKPLMAQAFIKSGTKREISSYYKNVWPSFVKKWILTKRRHLLNPNAPKLEISPLPETTVSPSAKDSNNNTTIIDANSKYLRIQTNILLFFVILLVFFNIGVFIHFSLRISRLEELLKEKII